MSWGKKQPLLTLEITKQVKESSLKCHRQEVLSPRNYSA